MPGEILETSFIFLNIQFPQNIFEEFVLFVQILSASLSEVRYLQLFMFISGFFTLPPLIYVTIYAPCCFY